MKLYNMTYNFTAQFFASIVGTGVNGRKVILYKNSRENCLMQSAVKYAGKRLLQMLPGQQHVLMTGRLDIWQIPNLLPFKL